jgi:outer membrane protein
VRTRLGFGVGVSYAQQVPFVELRDQVARGRNSSRLLNYLDPSIDISLGDLIGIKPMRDTYVGLGVSHRSGIFGNARLFGNVNGGSNYIYSYIEWQM